MDLQDFSSLGFHFTWSQIIASLFFGVVGFFVFKHGKKDLNYSLIFTGIALMIYPMFTSGWVQDWGVGVILCGLAYYFDKNHNLTG